MKQAMTITKKTFLIFGLLLLGSLAFGQNNAPVAVNDTIYPHFTSYETWDLLANDFDVDGNNLILDSILVSPPSKGVVQLNSDGTMTYLLLSSNYSSNYFILDEFSYRICDDTTGSLCDTATVVIDTRIIISDVLTILPSSCTSFDGSISIVASGNGGNLEYSIDGIMWQNSPVFNNLGTAIYNARVRNPINLQQKRYSLNTYLKPVFAPVIDSVSSTPANCNQSNGTIILHATPSINNLYSIDGGFTWQTDSVFNNLQGGKYSVTVKGINGLCQSLEDNPFNLYTLGGTADMFLQVNKTDSCGLNDGKIQLFFYNWDFSISFYSSIDSGITWNSANKFSNLSAGSYTLMYSPSPLGTCPMIISIPEIIEDNSTPTITNITSNDVSNCGLNDGSIVIGASGSINLQYSIDSGNTWQSSNIFNNLGAGTYFVKVKSGNMCSAFATGNTVIGHANVPIIASVTSTNSTNCNIDGGTITITASGGQGPLEYSIDNGFTWVANGGVFTGLGSGVYTIRVKSAGVNSCITTYHSTITILDKPLLIAGGITYYNPTSITAFDGVISIAVFATGIPIEYSINNGNTWSMGSNFFNLSVGTYSIRIRYSDGSCERALETITLDTIGYPVVAHDDDYDVPFGQTLSANVSLNDYDPDGQLLIYSLVDNPSTGIMNLNTDGTFTFIPDTNMLYANLTYEVCDLPIQNGYPTTCEQASISIDFVSPSFNTVYHTMPTCSNSFNGTIYIASGSGVETSIDSGLTWSQTGNYYNLGVGTYNILTRNINSNAIFYYVNNPLFLTALSGLEIDTVLYTLPTNCNAADGIIIVNPVSGGNYEYSINNGMNWQTSNSFTGLSMGTYHVMLRDVGGVGCQVNYLNNPVILTAPNAPSITNVSITNPTDCSVADGTITITATGGSAPLEYSINNGISWFPNGGFFTGLSGGTYPIQIRNNDGSCEVVYPSVTLIDKVPPTITNVTFTNPTTCGANDGTITITASGIGALQYSINGGVTWQPYIPGLTTFPNTSNTFTGLQAGTYQIRVRNIDGTCLVNYADVTLTLQNPLGLIFTSTNTLCGANNGTATVFPTVGTPPYAYMWGNGISQSTSTVTGLAPGTYYVTVTDANFCTDTASVTISSTSFPTITNVTTTNVSACGANDGAATVNYTGGVSPYTYLWSSGQTSQTVTNLTAGTYAVTVTDVNGCMDMASATVSGFVSPTITNISSINPTDCGVNDGTITISITNATGQELYTIDSGVTWQSSNLFTGLAAGTFDAVKIGVTNTNSNCTSFYTGNSIVLTSSILPIITAVNITQPTTCSSAGSVQITATGSSLEYSLDGGATWQPSNIFNLSCGSYDVAVRNSDGTCMVIYGQITLSVPFSITNVNVQDKICGQQEGKINITAQDGTGNYHYSIDSGATWQTVDSFTNLQSGQYYVMAHDGIDTLAYANNPVVINEVGTPTISTVYDSDFVYVNSTAAPNLTYSLDCGATWQASNAFYPVWDTIVCTGVRFADGSCPVFLVDTFQNTVPIAVPDIATFAPAQVVVMNVLTNDFDAENNALFVSNAPQTISFGSASVTMDSLGNVTIPTMNFSPGAYSFNYTACEVFTPSHCTSGTVTFTITFPSHHIFDTLAIGATAQICLPNYLSGTSVALTNVCGAIPNVVIDSVVGDCLYLYADNYGTATTCFVRCNNVGDCDTTFLHFTVQDGVWPGDADDNTVVNNFDLLAVGLGYGTSGTARDSVTNVWNGYLTPLWNVATPISNVDYRHLDCNGDGLINADDTLAIVQNYGFSYQRGGGGGFGAPLAVGTDTAYVLPHFTLPIRLGDLANPAVNVYGGAFSILYDTTFIKKDSVFITFNNSWVGTKNVDMLSIDKNFGDNQQIDVAFTRINGTNVTGFGEIGQLNFTIKDDILQRGMTLDSVIFDFYIINTKFISADEQAVAIAANSTSWVVYGTGVSTQSVVNFGQWINVFPNPATNYVQIQSPKLAIENIVITDGIGRTVLENKPTEKHDISLNINELPQGIYQLQLQTEQGVVVKRLVIGQ